MWFPRFELSYPWVMYTGSETEVIVFGIIRVFGIIKVIVVLVLVNSNS